MKRPASDSDISMLWKYDRRAFWAFAFLGCIVAGVFAGAYWATRILDDPAVATLNVSVVDPVIEQDGVMQLVVSLKSVAKRQCSGDITREFWRKKDFGGEILPEIWRSTAPRPILVDDALKYVVNVKLPPEIEPGVWSFRGETAYFCDGWFGTNKRYRSEIEDAITVVPKGSRQKN